MNAVVGLVVMVVRLDGPAGIRPRYREGDLIVRDTRGDCSAGGNAATRQEIPARAAHERARHCARNRRRSLRDDRIDIFRVASFEIVRIAEQAAQPLNRATLRAVPILCERISNLNHAGAGIRRERDDDALAGATVVAREYAVLQLAIDGIGVFRVDTTVEAVAALNGADFQGRPLTVNEAKPREARPRTTGYAGSGYGRY